MNVFARIRVPFLSFATFGSVFLAAASVFAFSRGAGDGGSFSGPHLGGRSIPQSLERNYSLAKIVTSTSSCLTDLAISVYEQAYRTSYVGVVNQRSNVDQGGSFVKPVPALHQLQFAPNACEYSIALSPTGNLNNDSVTVSGDRCEAGRTLPARVEIAFQGTLISLEIPHGLPYLRSKQASDGRFYDHFGRLDMSKIGGAELPVELVLTGGPRREALINRSTRAASGISVDVDGYGQCLRARLN